MSNTLSELKGIVGDNYVLDNPADMAQYLKGDGKPVAVVFPGDAEEVAKVVKYANGQQLKISVAGAVADTKGLEGGIALIMNRMNKILEIDKKNFVVTVEPGMLHQDFIQKLEADGYLFPVEPYAVDTSSVGGCFAIGDSDSKSFNYGPTRTFIMGFEMVTPTGDMMFIGNKCIKNVSGYDFIHFAVGSQGTFGIFTKMLIKLLPQPAAKRAIVARFDCLQKANATFSTLLKRHIHPDRMNLVSKDLAQEILPGEGHLVLIDLEGFNKSGTNLANEIVAILTLGGGTDVSIVEDKEAYEKLMSGWLKVRQGLNNAPDHVLEFAVGPMKMSQALAQLKGIQGELNSGVVIEGLLGVARVVLPKDADKMAVAAQVNKMAMSLGGNVTGLLGHKLMCEMFNDGEMWSETTGLLSELRSKFDPNGILNPGVSLLA
ncbi:FAD-binding oxidoreductase [Desulfitobacterium chlororespirans]|uniref:FAD/FMN-containing dehydrogenase n=1 Tax=Desulfitobacterium chlororespirans DSM 11544 TaxID=1121395 RepID=A0A1M7UYM6_9FIRM|nr:FAD-binding oxidoreductase [Desulfitobacterium chlororespirans]SHN88037.1 FAD/FMN-containing dehydrogenase [Desulfitobacterium chlororespirans DSM 11544]